MQFNIGNGLSAMGGAIEKTAGAAALEMQRSELDMQKNELASMLAEGRETRGREQQGLINAAAAEEAGKRSREELMIREGGADRRLATSEAGDTERARINERGANARHSSSEAAADSRLDKQLKASADAARKIADTAEKKRILESAIDASTTTEERKVLVDGVETVKMVKTFNPKKAAGILRDTGHPDLANPLDPKKLVNKTVKPNVDPPKFTEGQIVSQGGVQYKYNKGNFVPLTTP